MNTINLLFSVLYGVAVVGLSLFGFNALLLTLVFVWNRRKQGVESQPPLGAWPAVTVQLPVFNERLVVERLIDAAVALDYPRERLAIQVLDDSTDGTVQLARDRIAYHRGRGVNITHLQRGDRQGCKAGALASALPCAKGEFIAIFDADFLPPSDFLRRTLPHFSEPLVGMVQARWGHLNAEHSPLTRAQALALDGHFVVEQTARSRSGLMFTFNGSAGVWRRACIEDVGGWQADTLAEDLDLSYRAQLRGWQLRYLPDVVAPAEVPVQLLAFKRQQFRWVKGSIQCLRKFARPVARSHQSLWRRLQAFFHLGGYLVHPLMVLLLVTSLPVMLRGELGRTPLGLLGMAGLGPPVLYACSQITAYPDGVKRYLYFPLLMLIGAGIALNNTWAVIEALARRNPTLFLRTPKADVIGRSHGGRLAREYALTTDRTTWAELFLAVYGCGAVLLAVEREPGMAPFLLLFALGFGYTAAIGLLQSWQAIRGRGMWQTAGVRE